MKVAILTYARTNNYGATLQCYALNKYIQSLGHETIILNVPLDDGSVRKIKRPLYRKLISFVWGHCMDIYKKLFPQNQEKLHDYEIRYCLTKEQRAKEQEYSDKNMALFDEFRTQYLPNISEEYFYESDFDINYPEADAYVVGSDQVWNVDICKKQYPIFFLSFVKPGRKKISYAACMGGNDKILFSDEQKDKIQNLLKDFDSIAVRNQMAVTICQNNFHFTPRQVLDPTFLIDNYDELLAESSIDAKGCMYIDKFIINDLWVNAIKKIARDKGLQIRMDNCLIEIDDVPFAPLCRIQDWLKILKTSDLIFTDSFHCSVFCILFRKQFVVAPSYQGGEGRMLDLLDKMGIEGRFYYTPDDLINNIDVWSKPIDYDAVWARIEEQRVDSKNYLIEALRN